MRIAVLASGEGSLLQAILDDRIPVDLVVTDRPCRAIERAEGAGIVTELVERTDFSKAFDRDGYTQLVIDVLRKHDIELVVMAGFGTIIPAIAQAFPNRALNTHPALLPSFKGWHPVRDALAYGVKVTGWTVHIATEEVDAGPILEQEPVRVLDDDTEDTLHERIKEVERVRYPQLIRRIIEGEVKLP